MYKVLAFSFLICGTIAVTTWSYVNASVTQEALTKQITDEYLARNYGGKCPGCGKVHGAPGPVIGIAGAPLFIAGYAIYLWRRRQS